MTGPHGRLLKLSFVLLTCCEAGPERGGPERPVPSASSARGAPDPRDIPGVVASATASAAPAQGPCPADMVLVDTAVCPQVQRTCLKDEYSPANKITICHRFAEAPPKCLSSERRQRFCIDRYEAPNREGARAPVMVDFYDAMAACADQGKRLCWESEWIAACEGPDRLPFPYGYVRDAGKCNIDNRYIKPSLEKFYSTDERVSGPELTRLDQGVPSGAKPECKSGFGVHDQTGNVDEWVMLETKRGKGGWAGLKGGAWGHVRNACRPVTTSHVPQFTYYNISYRCCADAKPPSAGGAPPWTPPPIPENEKPKDKLFRGWSPR